MGKKYSSSSTRVPSWHVTQGDPTAKKEKETI